MITLSNGNSKFIVGTAAAEAHKRGLLDGYITAGYPTSGVQRALKRLTLDNYPSVRRFLARQEAVPESAVRPIWRSEVFNQVAGLLRNRRGMTAVSEHFDYLALRAYAGRAAHALEEFSSRIYHYRAGYGGKSVTTARRKGMVALCDHSIAHPAVLEYLVANGGQLPPNGQSGPVSRIWRTVLEDIDQADAVVVNSDFVKSTFLHQGWKPERVHVAYTGIDDEFLDAVPVRDHALGSRSPMSLVFAGEVSTRKGADILLRALQRIEDLEWRIEIIGTIPPEIRDRYSNVLGSRRVSLAGFIPRTELARRMSEADVFVFPSLCEGSARVIFMALACGCYVITTANSGSIVRDGIHGALVAPGSVEELEAALRNVMSQPKAAAAIGQHNSREIRSSFRQTHYGDALAKIYANLLGSSQVSTAAA